MVAILGYSREQIFSAVKGMYSLVAEAPDSGFHFPIGAPAARAVGYPAEDIDRLPQGVRDSFAGVGYPFHGSAIVPGDTVLDVGAGSGNDTLLAAHRAGGEGYVVALDLTPAMTRKLRDTVNTGAPGNIGVIQGCAESIPLADASVDSITTNGALNLVPDKRRAVAEMFRVLRPGGRLQIADVAINQPVTVDCDSDPRLWVECVVGATVEENLLALFRDAGFEDVEVVRRYDYFALSPSAQTREIAASFGAHTVELTMRRGAEEPSRVNQLLRRCNPVRVARNLYRHGLTGLLTLSLAIVTCYGLFALASLLAVLGMALPLDPGLWAGAILGFSLLAFVAVIGGYRLHADPRPLPIAAVGTGILGYTLLYSYNPLTELFGFAVLAAAVLLDRHLRRRREQRILGLEPSRDAVSYDQRG